jgi:hypothetical protein
VRASFANKALLARKLPSKSTTATTAPFGSKRGQFTLKQSLKLKFFKEIFNR